MTPTNVILARITELLAADVTTLGNAADELHVHLVMAAFTEGPELGVGDLTFAVFDGYAPLDGALGPQQEFRDTVTLRQTVQLIEPLGGWHWESTGTTGLPIQIFGWAVTNNADTVLYGTQKFDLPIDVTGSGQGVDVDQVRFELQPDALI